MDDLKKIFNCYLSYLKIERNYSLNTVEAYKKDVLRFTTFLPKEFHLYTREDIRFYLRNLKKKKKSNSSIIRNISSLKNFFSFLTKYSLMNYSPMTAMSRYKKKKNLPCFLYQNQLVDLLDSFPKETYLDERNRIIFEALYGLGIRISELSKIGEGDICFETKMIKINGKGRKIRFLPLTERLFTVFKNFIKIKNKALDKIFKSNEKLFLNHKGQTLSIRGIRFLFYKMVLKHSAFLKISPHALRHSLATHLLENDCDIKKVQEILGHSSLSSTQVYMHLSKSQLKKKYLTHHPLSIKKKAMF